MPLVSRTARPTALAVFAILAATPVGAGADRRNYLVPEGLPKVPGLDLERVVEDAQRVIPERVRRPLRKPPASPASPPARGTPATAPAPPQPPRRATAV